MHLQLWHSEVLRTMLLQLSSQSRKVEPPTRQSKSKLALKLKTSIDISVTTGGNYMDEYSHVSLCEDESVGHIQRSTSGPAGSKTKGLVASTQWLYPDDPGGRTHREKSFTADS